MLVTGWISKKPGSNLLPTSPSGKRSLISIAIAIIAVVFGVMTLKSGGSVLFIDGPDRAAAGNYVPFVLWFNFTSGFIYILAGVGIFLQRARVVQLSLLMLITTLAVFAAFGILVLSGSEYEQRTVGAMILRSAVWAGVWLYCRKTLKPV